MFIFGGSSPVTRAAQRRPALDDLAGLGDFEIRGDVPERCIEHPPLPVKLLPDDGHDRAHGPGGVLARERGRGQDLDARVDVHEVLLGLHVKARLEAPGDGIGRVGEVDVVVDDAARMGDPLAADHELVLDGGAVGIAQAAVPAGQADAALDGLFEVALLVARDVGHGKDVDDEIERLELGEIEVGVERVRDLDLEALRLEPGGEDVHALFGLVSLPAAPDDQGGLPFCGRRSRPGADGERREAGDKRGDDQDPLHGSLLHSSSRSQMFRKRTGWSWSWSEIGSLTAWAL